MVNPSPANPENRFALLRHALAHQLTVRRSLLPYALVVAVLAHGYWWFFLFSRTQSLYPFMAMVAYDNLSWNQRLMIRAPWVFETCSALLALAALWIGLSLRGRARSLAMFVLLVLLLAELGCLFYSIITIPLGGLSGAIH